jgi:hypothetical protein
MKCEQYQLLIEDYVDGVLDPKETALVSAHIVGCAACTRLQEELTCEREIYSRYQRDVEVSPLLLSSIEARIKQERAGQPPGSISRVRDWFAGAFAAPRLSPALVAALVVVAIGITVAVMSYVNSRNRELVANSNTNTTTKESARGEKAPPVSPPDKPAPTPSPETPTIAKSQKLAVVPKRRPSTSEPTPAQLVQEAEQKYLTAIAILSRDVNRRRSELDPMVLAKFDASLSEIDRTIRETRRVVRENPEDPIALQYLLAAYSKKVEVLRGMTND